MCICHYEMKLFRVSYCTVDPYNTSVFCYISRDRYTSSLACFAFLCSKRSKVSLGSWIGDVTLVWSVQAEAITLTVAQAFNIAYEKWQVCMCVWPSVCLYNFCVYVYVYITSFVHDHSKIRRLRKLNHCNLHLCQNPNRLISSTVCYWDICCLNIFYSTFFH